LLVAGEENDLNAPENKVGHNLNFNKMKKLILSLTGMGVALALVFSSCQKEGLKQSTKTNSEETHLTTEVKIPNSGIEYHGDTIFPEYYLNNKRIINADYDLNLSKSTNIIVAFLDSISKKKKISINSFTIDSEYYKFIDSKGYDLRKEDEFEKLIEVYIANNPFTKDEYDNNVVIRNKFLNFQDSLYNKIFGPFAKAPTTIHDSFTGGSSWVMSSPAVPVMAPGWNNRVSAFNNLNIASKVNFYSKRFFRKRMGSFFGFHGWQRIPFNGGLSFMNNRTSSVLH